MIKLTKQQFKNRERIEAWLKGEPFPENSRDKHPSVPNLSREDVFNQYTPLYVQEQGAYMTPPVMASSLGRYINGTGGGDVLEPCAGIGNLVAVVPGSWDVTAYELDQERYQIGSRLFPDAEWHHLSPFEHYDRLHSRFDLVLMNPPFNVVWATTDAIAVSKSGAKKSEHLFLDLAVNAMRPYGVGLFIAPFNYFEKLPKAPAKWVGERGIWKDLGTLPGEFALTKIEVHGWLFVRNDVDC